MDQNTSVKLLHRPCRAPSSRSKPQRKHAVSKQDRMREWKIPQRGKIEAGSGRTDTRSGWKSWLKNHKRHFVLHSEKIWTDSVWRAGLTWEFVPLHSQIIPSTATCSVCSLPPLPPSPSLSFWTSLSLVPLSLPPSVPLPPLLTLSFLLGSLTLSLSLFVLPPSPQFDPFSVSC